MSGQDVKNVEQTMNTKQKVDSLWRELRTAINKTYEDSKALADDDRACLRDYAEDISWSDDLAALLGREAANERQHRRNRPSPSGFSAETASKLILMNNVERGARMPNMPKATAFLMLRQTAVEAEVIGYLCREHLSTEWLESVNSLDYAKLMQ